MNAVAGTDSVAIETDGGVVDVTDEARASNSLPLCKICNSHSDLFGQAVVLNKHEVRYFKCTVCGFIQTEKPYWLQEAYSSAIAGQDVGAIQRNLVNREVTSAVLNLLFPKVRRALDFGAGHGVFVRLMRDRGFQFFWSDLHASNDYAKGFEYQEGVKYDFLTAFEVLEHLENPTAELSKLMELSRVVFVSTTLVPPGTARISDWWYFVPSTGQHISFYTREALQALAKRWGRTLLSNGEYHLFTEEPCSPSLYKFATRVKSAAVMNRLFRRPSLIETDFKQMTGAQ
jgi:hypothetical protein